MRYNEVSRNTLANLKPQHIRMYLNSRGWARTHHDQKFDIFKNENEEVLVPSDPELRDYLYRMEDLLDTLSNFEERPPSSIISSIMFATAADVIEYRYSSPDGEYGVIPVEDMRALLDAHIDITNFAYRDLMQWKPSYPNSRWEGSSVIEQVKMGQTAAGSYLVRFMYPSINDSGAQTNLIGKFVADDDTLKAICEKTLESLDIVVDYAESGKDAIEESKRVSYNFVNSVMSLDFKNKADLEVRKLPLHGVDIDDRKVMMTKKIFSKISNIERNMRPREMRKEVDFVGWLVRVQDERFQDEESPGLLTIQYIDDNKQARAKLFLKNEDLDTAYDAMRNKKPVKLKGTLVGSGRGRRIEDPNGLKIIN